uniref:Squalene synthase n=1 Tax=Palpitomonas bilix TaxID=652834 RepID=A0A7S3D7J1_9EUKA|mmetsp:Transcript_24730/g.62599  ORF Transcript_24730/g.62599 Transcript_24730/m.62599 type:complete len:422 (+) Transcript_24730:85-1350(+)
MGALELINSPKKVFNLLSHPSEIAAIFKLRAYAKKIEQDRDRINRGDENVKYAYDVLTRTSRSFASVILQLGDDLRDSVCIFYLVLRGLDTIEDDMSIPLQEKLEMLYKFPIYLETPGWNTTHGEDAYKDLMKNFDKIIDVYSKLPKPHREVISDITKRMGEGMAHFATREVVTKADWDQYCYYVAGLVGIGLSRLFYVSGLESEKYNQMDSTASLANSMGLFLQKTNITRDYLEDIIEGRIFWPKEVWSKYAEKLEDFRAPANKDKALACLNELITDALGHGLDCVDYMVTLQDKNNFMFCAVPQVMAIATLAECYNNYGVFTGVVKIRKGLAAKLITDCTNMERLYGHYVTFSKIILSKINPADPNARLTKSICEDMIKKCEPHASYAPSFMVNKVLIPAMAVGTIAFAIAPSSFFSSN